MIYFMGLELRLRDWARVWVRVSLGLGSELGLGF